LLKNHSTPVIPFPEASIAGIAAQPSPFEPLLNTEEAARLLGGIHPKTIMRWAREGEIPAFQIGRMWFFRASELNRWLLTSHKIRAANVPA
jgi:excisionase family DNA binding protein